MGTLPRRGALCGVCVRTTIVEPCLSVLTYLLAVIFSLSSRRIQNSFCAMWWGCGGANGVRLDSLTARHGRSSRKPRQRASSLSKYQRGRANCMYSHSAPKISALPSPFRRLKNAWKRKCPGAQKKSFASPSQSDRIPSNCQKICHEAPLAT